VGVIFGAYAGQGHETAVRSRFEAARQWFAASYPGLTIGEHRVGRLSVAAAVTSPLERREGAGQTWHAVAVGSFPDVSPNDPDVRSQKDARHAAERLSQADGRFGAVVWDDDGSAAFVVTDWAGWYPVFWTNCADAIVFSSHPAVLMRLIGQAPEIDPIGGAELLMLGYQLDARTLFKDVSVLRPGEIIALDKATIEKGDFRLPFSTDGFGATPERLHRRFCNALLDSVRRRIEGYQRVLLPLSGGMDSRFIGACLRELGADFVTASHNWYGRADPVIAKKVARKLHVDHHVFSISAEEMVDGFDRVGTMLCTDGPQVELLHAKLSRYDQGAIYLAGNVGDAMEGVSIPLADGSSQELHDSRYHKWRQTLWSDAEVRDMGRELGLNMDPEAVYAESLAVFRAHPALPFQQCIWWDYMGYQRRYITYQNRICDVYMPVGVPYVDRGLWAELLSWPRSMLTRRLGAREAMKTFCPDLAKIQLEKGEARSRITSTPWGSLLDAVAWRIPKAMRRVMPVCLGGGVASNRDWKRMVAALAQRNSWLKGRWRKRFEGSVVRRFRTRFLALASLLQQIEQCQSSKTTGST